MALTVIHNRFEVNKINLFIEHNILRKVSEI